MVCDCGIFRSAMQFFPKAIQLFIPLWTVSAAYADRMGVSTLCKSAICASLANCPDIWREAFSVLCLRYEESGNCNETAAAARVAADGQSGGAVGCARLAASLGELHPAGIELGQVQWEC